MNVPMRRSMDEREQVAAGGAVQGVAGGGEFPYPERERRGTISDRQGGLHPSEGDARAETEVGEKGVVSLAQVLGIIQDFGPCTIVDLWDMGLERGKPLHEALRTLVRNGSIDDRLEFAHSRHRIYSAK